MFHTSHQNRVNSARRTVPTLAKIDGELRWIRASRVVEVEGDAGAAANLMHNVREGRLSPEYASLYAAQSSITFEYEWLLLTEGK
jgi:hypothetical protein